MTLGIRERQAVAGFDPREIPGLEAWYDAAYINGIGAAQPNDGDLLLQWNDLSGKGRHALAQHTPDKPAFYSNPNRIDPTLTVLATGATMSGDGTVTIPNGGAVAWWAKIDELTSWRWSADEFTTSAGTAFPGQGSRLLTSTYYAADRTTNVLNTNLSGTGAPGYTSNGNAVAVPLNTVTRTQWSYYGGPGVVWLKVTVTNPSTYNGGSITLRKPTIRAASPSAPLEAWVSSMNGKPVVQFDGAVDCLITPAMNVQDGATLPVSMYCAFSPGGNNNFGASQAVFAIVTGQRLAAYVTNTATASPPTFYGMYGQLAGTNNAGCTIGSPHVGSGLSDGVDSTWSALDGSTLSSRLIGSGTTQMKGPLALGSLVSGSSSSYMGAISAVLLFSGKHDDATRHRVEQWLAARYGVPMVRP